MIEILMKKKVSLSMSSANHVGRWLGTWWHETAPPRGQKHVNNFNYYFSRTKMVQSRGFATPSGKKFFFFK